METNEEILGEEKISPDLAKTGRFFGLKTAGDGMFSKIEDGNIVIVKQQPDVESSDVTIVLVNDYDTT